MSTRSDIIVHRDDGKWARIYCHWNGYVEHNGAILQEHYDAQEKADTLIALGDLSVLGADIGQAHSFDDPIENTCVFYGRDRGETGTAPRTGDTLAEVWPGSETGTEFTYVYADPDNTGAKRWFVGDPDEGQQTLRDLGAILRGEEEEPKTAIKAFGGNFVIGRR